MDTKNQRAVYEWVIISDDLVYEWVRFFKGQVYDWDRFRNTGSHTHTKITPKLPAFAPPPPHPRSPSRAHLPYVLVKNTQFGVYPFRCKVYVHCIHCVYGHSGLDSKYKLYTFCTLC